MSAHRTLTGRYADRPNDGCRSNPDVDRRTIVSAGPIVSAARVQRLRWRAARWRPSELCACRPRAAFAPLDETRSRRGRRTRARRRSAGRADVGRETPLISPIARWSCGTSRSGPSPRSASRVVGRSCGLSVLRRSSSCSFPRRSRPACTGFCTPSSRLSTAFASKWRRGDRRPLSAPRPGNSQAAWAGSRSRSSLFRGELTRGLT
jgi:hypothetical protein